MAKSAIPVSTVYYLAYSVQPKSGAPLRIRSLEVAFSGSITVKQLQAEAVNANLAAGGATTDEVVVLGFPIAVRRA